MGFDVWFKNIYRSQTLEQRKYQEVFEANIDFFAKVILGIVGKEEPLQTKSLRRAINILLWIKEK